MVAVKIIEWNSKRQDATENDIAESIKTILKERGSRCHDSDAGSQFVVEVSVTFKGQCNNHNQQDTDPSFI